MTESIADPTKSQQADDFASVFGPVNVPRTYEKVIESIVDAIDSEGLREGDRLPNMGELAVLFGVSLPTLRQAIRILENAGVLKVKAGSTGGIFIATEMVPFALLGDKAPIDEAVIRELLETRRMLEPVAYHLAAERGTEADFVGIRDAIELMKSNYSEPGMLHRADGAFHRRVAHTAKNQVLLEALKSVYVGLFPLQELMIFEAFTADPRFGLHMAGVHERQLDAMRAQDHNLIDRLLEETLRDLEAEYSAASKYAIKWVPAPPNLNDPYWLKATLAGHRQKEE